MIFFEAESFQPCIVGSPEQNKCIGIGLKAIFGENDPWISKQQSLALPDSDPLSSLNLSLQEITGLSKADIRKVNLAINETKFEFFNVFYVPQLNISIKTDSQLLKGVLRMKLQNSKIKYKLIGNITRTTDSASIDIKKVFVDFDTEDFKFDLTQVETSDLSE